MPYQQLGGLDSGGLGGFGGLESGLPPRRRRRREEQGYTPPPPEQEKSLLKQIAEPTLGFAAAVGNVLDVPGSVVRDVVSTVSGTPANPLDQLLPWNWTSPEGRTTGRDLARQWGMAGKQDTWKNFGGGLGLEIAMDPLTYVGIGGLGKGLQTLKKANVLDDAALAAYQKGVGRREFRMANTVEDVLNQAPSPARARGAFNRAARASGLDPSALMQEKGSLTRIGIPFTDIGMPLGTGPRALAVGKAVDKFSRAIRASTPGVWAYKTFDSTVGDLASNLDDQILHKRNVWDAEKLMQRSNQVISDVAYSMYTESDLLNPDVIGEADFLANQLLMKRVMEDDSFYEALKNKQITPNQGHVPGQGTTVGSHLIQMPPGQPQHAGVITQGPVPVPITASAAANARRIVQYREIHDGLLAAQRKFELESGLKSPALNDYINTFDKMNYSPRMKVFLTKQELSAKTKLRELYDTSNPHAFMRTLRGSGTGTEGLVKMSMDPDLKITLNDYGAPPPAQLPPGAAPLPAGKEYNIVGLLHQVRRPEDIIELQKSRMLTASVIPPGQPGAGTLQPGEDIIEAVGGILKQKYPDVIDGMEDADRASLIRWLISIPPEHATEKIPFFSLDPFEPVVRRIEHGTRAAVAGHSALDAAVLDATALGGKLLDQEQSVMKFIEKAGMDTNTAPQAFINKLVKAAEGGDQKALKAIQDVSGNHTATPWVKSGGVSHIMGPNGQLSAADITSRMSVSNNLTENASRYLEGFMNPKAANTFWNFLDWVNNWFKPSVTTPWPAFHIRNLSSGGIQSWMHGAFKGQPGVATDKIPGGAMIRNYRSAAAALQNDAAAIELPAHYSKGRTKAEALQNLWRDIMAHDLIRKEALGMSDIHEAPVELAKVTARQAFRERFPTMHVGGKKTLKETVLPQGLLAPPRATASLGDVGVAASETWGAVANADLRREAGASLNKTLEKAGALPGMKQATWLPRTAIHAGQQIGNYTESLNRIAPFLGFIEQGYSPAEAAKMVKRIQIDYGSLTLTERKYFKRLMPFYTFMAKSIPPLVDSLVSRPGGRTAQFIRGVNRGHNAVQQATTPEYITDTPSVPVGRGPEGGLWNKIAGPPKGTNRFVTGFGMMMEDPLSLISPLMAGRVQDTALELGSRLNPGLRLPAEMATGQVFFQRGPGGQGGRPMEDLDPTIARTIANIKERVTGVEQREPIRLLPKKAWDTMEFALGASPVSRALTTIRQLSDPRKQIPVKALNVLTGMRISDVSPQAQDAILQERLRAQAKKIGGRTFETAYFPAERKARMSPSTVADALAIEQLYKAAESRAKARSKQRKAKQGW